MIIKKNVIYIQVDKIFEFFIAENQIMHTCDRLKKREKLINLILL